MSLRLASLLDHPVAFAHRGGRAHAPENSLGAFSLALRLGATGLETDAYLTSDAEVVLDHDGTIRKGIRTRRIGELTRDQVPADVPSLRELLRACGTQFHLSIDLKDPAVGRPVIDLVRSLDPDLLRRLWLCHPDHEVLSDLRRYDAQVRLIDSTRLERIKEGPERRAARLAEAGIDGLNMFHTDWNAGLVTLLHRFQRVAFAWGLEFERQFQATLRMGIDAVYSDWVDRMMDTYRAELGRPAL